MEETALFSCLIEMCMSAGGDGNTILTSPNYRQWANKFKIIETDWNIESDDDKHVTFILWPESHITFTTEEYINELKEKGIIWCDTDGRIVLKY